jgi:solute carrier family 25 (mitochondrial uncoupling protein), member 8/9
MTGKDNENILAKAAIACFSSSFASAVLNGLDVTKIRMQNKNNKAYTSLFGSMKKIYREEGVSALTKGMEASMYREAVYSTLRISGYEQIRRAMAANSSDPTNTNPALKFVAALASGGLGSALANPFDLIKTRFQAVLPHEQPPYRNTFHAIGQIYKANGWGGLYKGWAVTSARAAVLTSAQLGSYDSIKHNLCMKVLNIKEGFTLHLAVSMIAGVITTTASNPCESPRHSLSLL